MRRQKGRNIPPLSAEFTLDDNPRIVAFDGENQKQR